MKLHDAQTVLCTVATGHHQELFEVTRPSFERFAAHHGYELIVSHDELSAGRPPAWGKIVLLRELIESHDRVVWVNADAVIIDPTTDIFDTLPRRKSLAMVVHHYDGLEVPNAGVLALRSCRWTKRFLRKVWTAERFIDHKWWDNAAMIELLGYDVSAPRRSTRRNTFDARHVSHLDLSWNSIPLDQSPAPRIVHFPGMTQIDRLAGMRSSAEWIARLSAHNA